MMYVFKIILKMKICVEEISVSLLFSYMNLITSERLFFMVSGVMYRLPFILLIIFLLL